MKVHQCLSGLLAGSFQSGCTQDTYGDVASGRAWEAPAAPVHSRICRPRKICPTARFEAAWIVLRPTGLWSRGDRFLGQSVRRHSSDLFQLQPGHGEVVATHPHLRANHHVPRVEAVYRQLDHVVLVQF